MAKIMSLDGADGLGKPKSERCKCVRNSRTGKGVRLCFVGKSKKHRSGWAFQKGGC